MASGSTDMAKEFGASSYAMADLVSSTTATAKDVSKKMGSGANDVMTSAKALIGAAMAEGSSAFSEAVTGASSPSEGAKRSSKASWRAGEIAMDSHNWSSKIQPLPRFRISMVLTFLGHAAVVTFSGLLHWHGGYGLMCTVFCALHLAAIFGFIGPSAPGRAFYGGVGWWVPSQVHEPYWCFTILLIGIIHYFMLGVIEFRVWSYDCPEDSTDASELLAAGCELAITWDYVMFYTVVDRIYFTIVLLTTVGYGNTLTPSSAYERLFTLTCTPHWPSNPQPQCMRICMRDSSPSHVTGPRTHYEPTRPVHAHLYARCACERRQVCTHANPPTRDSNDRHPAS